MCDIDIASADAIAGLILHEWKRNLQCTVYSHGGSCVMATVSQSSVCCANRFTGLVMAQLAINSK